MCVNRFEFIHSHGCFSAFFNKNLVDVHPAEELFFVWCLPVHGFTLRLFFHYIAERKQKKKNDN